MGTSVWSRVERVTVAAGEGRLDVSAVRRDGDTVAMVLVEGWAGDGELACAGTIGVWELNQVVASLIASGSQARRLVVRDDGRGLPGHLDLVCAGDEATVVASGATDARTARFAVPRLDLAARATDVVRHFMTLTREARVSPDVVVLPDAPVPGPAG